MARNHLNRRFYEKVTTDCISSQEGILWSASQEAFLSSLVSWDCAEVRAKWRCKVPLTQPCMLESPPRESMSHVPWRQGREVWGRGCGDPQSLSRQAVSDRRHTAAGKEGARGMQHPWRWKHIQGHITQQQQPAATRTVKVGTGAPCGSPGTDLFGAHKAALSCLL